jgi:hypothetical protein
LCNFLLMEALSFYAKTELTSARRWLQYMCQAVFL